MDRSIVKRAMVLNGEGLRITQIAKRLGVNIGELRKEMATYNDFEECTVIVEETHESLRKTALGILSNLFKEIGKKIGDPCLELGELTNAAAICYRIYKEEEKKTGDDGNDNPVTQLFGNEIKLLKEKQ
jgi:hypothetical protein